MATLSLSLVSHTNVGKTTLARTLLSADVGEVRDEAHVTEFADGHELVATAEGDVLRLWDTPGFGDSARLAARLQGRGNPIGWFLAEVWDRWRDRALWASQQALRHVQAESDVLLYLVNAADAPSQQGYVAAEMRILAWVGKPVVVLLNQMGPPREAAVEAAEVAAWRDALAPWPLVKQVLPLDAFARCWVHESVLLDAVQAVLPVGPESEAMARLAAAWRTRREAVFSAAMAELARGLAQAAAAREAVDDESTGTVVAQALRQIGQTLTGQGSGSDRATARAELALAGRIAGDVQAGTAALLRLHGLRGEAQAEVLSRVAGQFAHQPKLAEGKSALVGGVLTGALTGLKADIATGGLTLGGGLIVGAVLGALGGAGIAKGFNRVRGIDRSSVALSIEALHALAEESLLRYLAVAHFGRGRGDWVAGEAPPHWAAVVREALAAEREALQAAFGDRSAAAEPMAQALAVPLARAARRTLATLYPRTIPHSP
jgi:hypothetical protein